MEIINRIHEEEAEIAFFLREEMNKMNFVKIGKRVVNLDTVQTMYYEASGGLNYDSPCVVIDFGGAENNLSIFNKYEPDAFKQLRTWMDEQPGLLEESKQPASEDEFGTHPPDCGCCYCSAE